MIYRRRYSSPLGVFLALFALMLAGEQSFVWAVIVLVLAVVVGTTYSDDPSDTVTMVEMVYQVLRMIPSVFIWTVVMYLLAMIEIPIIALAVTTLIVFLFVPVWVSGDKSWYWVNPLLVVIGYWLVCVACMQYVPALLWLVF